jgi:cyclic pyranopterin phosphate synthase
MEEQRLSHVGDDGRATMVDVGAKPVTDRRAVAGSRVVLSSHVLDLIERGETPKGAVLRTAELAGVQAAKRTAELIPLCHPLALSQVQVFCAVDREAGAVTIRSEVCCTGRTGVEMEALTAASIAALTVYDMIKAVDRGAIVGPTQLLEKSGGASGSWRRDG